MSEEEIASALAEERDAVLPQSWQEGGREKHLDVQRSEFGEIIASEVLKQVFDTSIPAARIAHKEIPDQQTRGADVMGLEGIELSRPTLIVGEVKGSQSRKSPPGVVGQMVTKLEALSTNRRAMLQELAWLRDYSEEEYADICARIHASFLLKKDYFEIVLSPLLVRTDSTHHPNDAGDFRLKPGRFKNRIRWVSIVVEGDLFELAQEVYRIAREGAA
ncbi:Hachiman antiphage defense system protein HamA [Streptomyces sp. NPDC057092]|uniref:Hachiman antiphage defense system protein HamA n=1 Tax=Streptomyces sp. NPDC057092 TaxID=3346017 RepID=UPI00363701AD